MEFCPGDFPALLNKNLQGLRFPKMVGALASGNSQALEIFLFKKRQVRLPLVDKDD